MSHLVPLLEFNLLDIETALGLRPLTRVLYRELAAWLLPTTLATDHGPRSSCFHKREK
jgi:hypothetical protein